jgi:hypothetical protein
MAAQQDDSHDRHQDDAVLGLARAATVAARPAPSAWPSMSSAMVAREKSAPKASTWPQIAESYQVTGLKR